MREDLEKELHMVDEELEFLFDRLEQLINKRKNLISRIREASGREAKEREKYIKHAKK